MNGEMFQIASITAAAKKAIQLSEPIQYSHQEYINRIEFAFLPQEEFSQTKKYLAPNVSAWFEQIRKQGVQDVKLLCPSWVKDRSLLGFSNTTKSSMLCFYENGKVTYFTPAWQFDSAQNQWNVLYSEHDWDSPPLEKLKFDDNTDSFRAVLLSIREFAIKIKCKEFAKIFDSAIKRLDGDEEYPDKELAPLPKHNLQMSIRELAIKIKCKAFAKKKRLDDDKKYPDKELLPLPKHNLQMFEAASMAHVFGAMGSWNDDPHGMAKEKGLEQEYDTLSNELLENIRLAILYAINEW